MSRKILFVLLFSLFLVNSCSRSNEYHGCTTAIRVIDGDTFITNNKETIRLIGIDAPEIGRPYSRIATNELKGLILLNCLVLEKDISNKDKFGRLLRYVYADNYSVNEALVQKGLAIAAKYEPDIKYSAKFEELESYAKNKKLGIWNNSLAQ